MAGKLRNKRTAAPVEEAFPEEEVKPVDRCIEWCFLPGLSYVGASGLLQCTLERDHEEEQHQIQVEILSPPAGKFTINWTR